MKKKLGAWRLAAMMFFTVSGGPYALEEAISGLGWRTALAATLLVPLIWALPTALLTSQLAAARPSSGGYYSWVRDACGRPAGGTAAWIALVMSVFDMAIYPALALAYAARIFPIITDSAISWCCSVVIIAAGAAISFSGSRIISAISVCSAALLLAPFAVIAAPAALSQAAHVAAPNDVTVMGALLLCMWNYMGWDNSSTLSVDVDRPEKTYHRALAITLTAVTACYAGAVLITSRFPGAAAMTTGSWVDVASYFGGRAAAIFMATCGVICGVNMFCALVSSYAQLPAAMARDGLLPAVFAKTSASGVPYVSVSVACAAYALSTVAGVKRLMELDVLLYGALYVMQAAAFICLSGNSSLWRIVKIAYICGAPIALLGFAVWAGRAELSVWSLSSAELGAVIVAVCALVASVTSSVKRSSSLG